MDHWNPDEYTDDEAGAVFHLIIDEIAHEENWNIPDIIDNISEYHKIKYSYIIKCLSAYNSIYANNKIFCFLDGKALSINKLIVEFNKIIHRLFKNIKVDSKNDNELKTIMNEIHRKLYF